MGFNRFCKEYKSFAPVVRLAIFLSPNSHSHLLAKSLKNALKLIPLHLPTPIQIVQSEGPLELLLSCNTAL